MKSGKWKVPRKNKKKNDFFLSYSVFNLKQNTSSSSSRQYSASPPNSSFTVTKLMNQNSVRFDFSESGENADESLRSTGRVQLGRSRAVSSRRQGWSRGLAWRRRHGWFGRRSSPAGRPRRVSFNPRFAFPFLSFMAFCAAFLVFRLEILQMGTWELFRLVSYCILFFGFLLFLL